MAKRLTNDWRLWAGLALAVLLVIAGVIATEYPRVAAIRQLRRSGWVIHGEPVPYPATLLRVESRLPQWALSSVENEWQQEWFVRAVSAQVLDSPDVTLDPPNLGHLEPLRDLRQLNIWTVQSSVPDLAPVSNLRALESVEIWMKRTLTIAEVGPLQTLPRLKRLSLRAPDIDDEALDALSRMTHLEELTIYSPGVTQRLSPAITALQSQKHVTLRVGDDQQ